MKQNTYCLISPVLEDNPLWPSLYSIKQKLRASDIPHNLPKLQWHVTYVTPFLATPHEIQWLALGLDIGKAISPAGYRERLVRSTSFDFYESEEEDTFILRLETDEEFRTIISRSRALIEQITDMRYPPESFQVNFHVTIAKGKRLSQHIKESNEMSRILTETKTRLITNLQFPRIFLQGKDYWAPIV